MRGAAIVLVLVFIAFVVRCVLITILRPIAPRAAEFVDRWWVWVPLLAVIVVVGMWSWPLGVVVAAATLVIVALDTRIDLPFRDRR